MAPTVHCVRHAQGFHNLCAENHAIPDPLLTPLGEEQCSVLREKFPYHSNVSLLITSPFRRTIYTTLISFGPALANGHCRSQIIALPEIQETSDFPCDTGSDAEKLRKEMIEKCIPIDLSLVKPGWNIKSLNSKWAPSSEALTSRAREARKYIRDRIFELQREGETDPEIVVMTHGGFLHYFTEDWEDSKAYTAYANNKIDEVRLDIPGTGWHNTEYRSFNFADLDYSKITAPIIDGAHANGDSVNGASTNRHLDDYENATLRETAESRDRRGKVEPQHGREKQGELFSVAISGWEDHASKKLDQVVEEEDALQDDEQDGLVRVLTKDSEIRDKSSGEAPATERRVEAATDAVAKERRRRKSSSVTAVAA